MNDSVLVEALRAGDPGALAALYDTYAESLYGYARAMLDSSDNAQVALRDTLIAAEAHVHALADPERLRVWLYALARGECMRRRSVVPAGDGQPTVPAPPVEPDAPDADLRLVAVNAVAALPDDEREVLDLLTRHAIPEGELAAVLGVAPAEAEQSRQAASARLQRLVTAEILARNGQGGCAGRAAVLEGFSGDLDAGTRARLLDHLDGCPSCAPHGERQVSAAKVFTLLPRPVPPETLRVRVMSCFIDPELLPYRRFVARRTGLLDTDGFPLREIKGDRRWPQALAGAVAAVAIGIGVIVLLNALNGMDDRLSGVIYGALPAPKGSSGQKSQAPEGSEAAESPAGLTPVAEGGPTLPARPPGSAVPVAIVRPGPPGLPRVPAPSPLPPGRTPAPSSPAPAPSGGSSTPPATSPAATPPPVGTPVSPRPPRQRPPDDPAPRPSHQHGHGRTPCPSTTPTAPSATPSALPSAPPSAAPTAVPSSSPAPTGDPSPTAAPSAGHGHGRHGGPGGVRRPEGGSQRQWLQAPDRKHGTTAGHDASGTHDPDGEPLTPAPSARPARGSSASSARPVRPTPASSARPVRPTPASSARSVRPIPASSARPARPISVPSARPS
ncbi:zf-HC2 domain-containing protein [Sphaerisporangium fuscum]|uniref:zf-HC2 domain-containing protein n=1 Tax=Sphaerisporangium fuscum TaxID=2835868 RepID=UPI001BDD33C4|nr:zf-HC2 domain-containing protein [Sphaerisporangium fuscum]